LTNGDIKSGLHMDFVCAILLWCRLSVVRKREGFNQRSSEWLW